MKRLRTAYAVLNANITLGIESAYMMALIRSSEEIAKPPGLKKVLLRVYIHAADTLSSTAMAMREAFSVAMEYAYMQKQKFSREMIADGSSAVFTIREVLHQAVEFRRVIDDLKRRERLFPYLALLKPEAMKPLNQKRFPDLWSLRRSG